MARMPTTLLLALALATCTSAATVDQRAGANPIRKVVTMLESMAKKVEEEGVKEKELFDKFMCYCKTSGSDLAASIAAAGTKIPAVGAEIKEKEAALTQTKADLATAQTERDEAKAAVAAATASREKEAAAYAGEKSMYTTNIASITAAVAALEKGVAGSFLQTKRAQDLRKLVNAKQDMLEEDRQDVLSFLGDAQASSYAPSSGEVIGILKQMGDEMAASLKEATGTEEGAIKGYEELVAAKTKELEALQAAVEAKTARIGELGVSVAQLKGDLSDTEEALLEDQEFAATITKSCKTKEAEWSEIVKVRGEELVALSETIKILNDDDSLELFKKTLPSASASFMQVEVTSAAVKSRALAAIRALKHREPRVDLIALALHGRGVDYSKVTKMIDEMVSTLKEEQIGDDHKKEYCLGQFDEAEDKKKGLERTVSDEEAAIAAATDDIAKVTEEIKALTKGIKDLDKSVAEATEQRKEESEDFASLMASDSAAKELLGFAKNRLNKFYNPKLYKAPPKRVLSEEDSISVSFGGTMAPTMPPGGIAGTGISLVQVRAHKQSAAAPPPPPETFGAYTKKTEENTGVIAMMDLLIKDLDKEMTTAKTEEADAQADYEATMKASATKRAADAKLLTEKEATKASLEDDLETHTEGKASASSELMATEQYISQLHAECDWLLKYFDTRKSARDAEIDALGKAKAVLAGADYSLLQMKSSGFLARH
jgi:septal ring factor EnvC (AmiA/AmiB activator)